jgi:hypothetical protein
MVSARIGAVVIALVAVALFASSGSASPCADDYERILNGSFPHAKAGTTEEQNN